MAGALDLTQRREWWGRWWLPDEPEEKFSGVLEYSRATGASLRMVGGFEYHVYDEPAPGMRTYTSRVREWPVIFGQAENRALTLLGCTFASAQSYTLDEPETLQIRAQMILDGCWLPDPEKPAFVGAGASIENLTWWAPGSSITGKVQSPGPTPTRLPVGEYQVGPVDGITATTHGMTIAVSRSYTLPRLQTTRSETVAKIRDAALLNVQFEAPVALDSALEPIRAIRDLISVATSDACGIISQQVLLEAQVDAYPEDHPLAGRPHEVDCYRREQVVATPDGKTPDSTDLLVSLDDIAFADLVHRWFDVRAQFQAATNIILGMRYTPSPSLESRVTSAVGAAESFHRALNPPPPITPDEFKEIRKVLLNSVAEQYRTWLSGLLSRNEPSLRARLLDLAARLDRGVAAVILADPEAWAAAATKARNTLAHTGQSSKHTLEQLFAVSEVTAAIVILNLLQELSVPPSAIIQRMSQNQMLGRAIRLAKAHFEASDAA